MGNVAAKLQKQEAYSFYDKYNHYKDSTVKF
jgi:two-component system phosphate regulon sensor histidine kinase PhoR